MIHVKRNEIHLTSHYIPDEKNFITIYYIEKMESGMRGSALIAVKMLKNG